MTKLVFALSALIALQLGNFAYAGKIAYCSNNGTNGFLQVFVMDEDGSGKTQLTRMDENCMRPEWSPDGKQIVFYTDRGRVYLIRDIAKAANTDPYYLWNGYYPSFLPGGEEVIFNNEVDEVLSILVIDTLAGSEPQQVSEAGYSNMQDLTPEGDKLVYSTFVNGTKAVVMIDMEDPDNSSVEIISSNKEANLEPDISADGKMVTYASFDDNLKGTIRIYKNGSEAALTKGMPSTNVPRFSPDGKLIAFAVISSSDVSLYLMDTDGNNKREVSISGGSLGTYEWIDNNRILYDAGTETKLSVGIVDVSSGNSTIIAEGDFNLHPAYWKGN